MWDMASGLTTPHEKALMLLFAELEGAAAEQPAAFLGTPGAITERTNENGAQFLVHRYSAPRRIPLTDVFSAMTPAASGSQS
jgi:hypothetical protein